MRNSVEYIDIITEFLHNVNIFFIKSVSQGKQSHYAEGGKLMYKGRIKSTETTISCRIDIGQKNAFLNTLARYDLGSNEPYKYRPGTILRSFIRAYTAEPELFQKLIEKYD